jgi:hypothetical protein
MSIPNQIHSYLHCAQCIKEDEAPDIEVGITPNGIQVWCKNHNINVAVLKPSDLRKMIKQGAVCDACKRGLPHVH